MKKQLQRLVEQWNQLATHWKVALAVGIVIMLITPLAMCTRSETADTIPQIEEPEEIEVVEPVEEEPEEVEEEPKEPNYRAPLTYEGMDRPVNKRPYAVLIENSPQARPQSGLDKADIVYEVLAEGSITRFIAIYQSQFPESIGPIRSARKYMLDIAGYYDAVIVHAGGSPGALEQIRRQQLPSLSEIINGAYFKRESFRRAPHNVYSNVELLDKGVEARNYRQTYNLPEIPFALDKEIRGEDVTEVLIPYSSTYQVKYRYSDLTGNYHRFINNMAHTDLVTNQQLQATNVFIVFARHSVMDNEGRLNINLESSGRGYALQQGTVQEVTWRHEGGVVRYYVGGQEIERLPGNTWVQIVPDIVAVSIQQ
ncbi:DUF3048 domain-containing protein [Desulfuribacillus alkaliarsenatis]|uniref:Lipoprotein YerB n=1 Tax=Desulfuribacillus alkaliarsenatis TaxID=766136 RepID=A0A1E5G255_9FIRM|nr:DUF3048 domain-containing protein [Desulfuribacillus alkaliarsenatis]OEF97024.1 hypothetical protein BHF68_05340 [Desulfuribacillus alkaliarsenatis]